MSDNIELFSKQIRLQILQSIVVILVLPTMLGVSSWMAYQIVDHNSRLAVLEADTTLSKIEEDIEDIEVDLEDHETRIRVLEK